MQIRHAVFAGSVKIDFKSEYCLKLLLIWINGIGGILFSGFCAGFFWMANKKIF